MFCFFFSPPGSSDDLYKKYVIKVAGIKIGHLDWKVGIDNDNYYNRLNLESSGLLSAIYSFEGEYFSEGLINNKELQPLKYSHKWKTKKALKHMRLIFSQNKLVSLEQKPTEKEHLRLNVFNVSGTKDPLSSFLQIILGQNESLVLDGRRIYKMNAVYSNEKNSTSINITDYINLWADHKKNKFEKMVFKKNEDSLLPTEIEIHFDGRVFRLK